MKSKGLSRLFVNSTAITAVIVAVPSVRAASATWNGTTSAIWSEVSNWTGPPVTVPGTGDIATFDNVGNSNTTLDLGAGVTVGSLVFDTSSAAPYTIGSGGAGGQTLTLDTVGNAITMNSTVANNELIDSNLALSVTRTVATPSSYYAVTNDSLTNTLALAGGISASTAGVKVLNVTGSGNTAISGAVASGTGNMSLFKTGSGTLTLSGGGGTFSGTGVRDGANFDSSAVFREGTTILNGGAYNNSGGELVIGGVATHGGAGTNTTLQLDNGGSLTNMNWLSIGRGNGNGTATSNLILNGSSSISSTNMSAGYNAGNALNIPKGAITLNGTSSLNVTGTFNLGESPGSTMTMTLNDTSAVTLGSGVIAVGVQSGSGTLNVNSGSAFTTNGEIRVAYSGGNGTFTGNGTINVNGGTVTTRALTVARNNNDVASTLTATVNVNSGTVNVTDQTTLIGWRGIGANGTLNISGGSFNQGTTATNNLVVGSFNGANGAVNVSGGALTLQRNSNLLFSNVANGNATRTLTITGGNTTFYSDAGTTVGGTGVIDLMNTSNPTGTNTINLNGGTLTANQIKAASATGTRVINFNGGTLKSGDSGLAATFLASGVATTANVRNGGAIIDTNGNNVTIGQALLHTDIGGDNATDGGLTKSGGGTLTITPATTYTGNTTVSAGTLVLSANSATSFDDASTVSIAGDAFLDLPNAGTDTVASLVLGGATQAAGTYGPTGSLAQFTTPRITGTGFIQVVGGGGGGYSAWASANASNQTKDLDHDFDGIDNGIEYFSGFSGSGFNLGGNGTSSGNTVTWTKGGTYTGTYGTDFVVQSSTDLVTWSDVPVGTGALGTVTNNAGSVTYTPPTGQAKRFGRLVVNN